MTKGLTCLLKKWIPFHWDDTAHKSFDALKDVLVQASLLYPPDYKSDCFQYLATMISTTTMVLVHEDDIRTEHPISYISRKLNDAEIQYTHVKSLALTTVQAVQIFFHYILLQKTMVVSYCNPMTYILSCQLLGENNPSGLLFSKILTWNSSYPSRRNP